MCQACKQFPFSHEHDPRYTAVVIPTNEWFVWGRGPLTKMQTRLEADLLTGRSGQIPNTKLAGWFLLAEDCDGPVLMPVGAAAQDQVEAAARTEALRRWCPVKVIRGDTIKQDSAFGHAVAVVMPCEALDLFSRGLDGELPGGVIPLAKAGKRPLDPNKPGGFNRIVADLGSRLKGMSDKVEVPLLRKALQSLRVDWPGMDKAARKRVIDAAMRAVAMQAREIMPSVQVTVEMVGKDVMAGAKAATGRTLGFTTQFAMDQMDKRVVAALRSEAGHYVTNRAGEYQGPVAESIKGTVEQGIEQGLGGKDIADKIEPVLRAQLDKGRSYAEIVAQAWVQDSRSYGQMRSYDDAGIEKYQVEAVLDEKTSPICRFLHGKVFSVGVGLDRFASRKASEDPQDIKRSSPWIRLRGSRLGIKPPGGAWRGLATEKRTGVGTRDDVGEFDDAVDEGELEEAGIGFPPYHVWCRSTTLAVVSGVEMSARRMTRKDTEWNPDLHPRDENGQFTGGGGADDVDSGGGRIAGHGPKRTGGFARERLKLWVRWKQKAEVTMRLGNKKWSGGGLTPEEVPLYEQAQKEEWAVIEEAIKYSDAQGKEAQAFVTEHFMAWGQGLSIAEEEAFQAYTDAPSGKMKRIQEPLRKGRNPSGKSKEHMVNLDRAIARSVLPQDVDAYRGIGKDELEGLRAEGKLVVGAEYTPKTYTSVSLIPDVPVATHSGGFAGGAVIRMSIPAGKSMAFVGNGGRRAPAKGTFGKGEHLTGYDEDEGVLPRGTAFRVRAVEEVVMAVGDGEERKKTFIDVEVL